MNEEQQIKGLEKAILDRANGLANELQTKAAHQRDGILRNASERLHLTEQREVLLAKATADRIQRRRVQAGELRLQGRLEQLRWQLVREVEQRLPARLEALRADRAAYLDWLACLIQEAVALIPEGELVAEVNAEDLAWLPEHWAALCARAAPGRALSLDPRPGSGAGGVLLRGSDNRVRLDNRFEGRLARQQRLIRRTIQQQLFRPVRGA